MAQREQHERVKKMDRWAGKLLGHKAVVMAILVVIAMASGLAMANFGGGAGGVSFERTDGSGTLVEPGSGDASSGKTSEGSSPKASERQRSMSMLMAPWCHPVYIASKTGRGWLRRLMPPAGWRPKQTLRGLIVHPKSLMDKKFTFQR